MVESTTRRLFEELQKLRFGAGKPDTYENLLDVLEIVAVEAGRKPAHLQGQGQRDETTMEDLERIAASHGLIARRTSAAPSWHHRPYRGDPGYWAYRRSMPSNNGDDVLWIYRDAAASAQVDEAVAGRLRVGAVLGYPECCELQASETGMLLDEELERCFREQHNAISTDDLIRCAAEDVLVRTDFNPGEGMAASTAEFPFIQFQACRACVRDKGSPAAKVNNAMRLLVRELDAGFTRRILSASR